MADLHMPTLRQAVSADWEVIRPLLVESLLPVDDLGANKLRDFLVVEDGSAVVGLIGLQLFGTIGLLRSLVVAKRARSLGLGGKLVGALESAAQTAGIRELWLLTIDAGEFFEQRGYDVMSRDAAPESIRQTEEFSDLCPGNAILMCKTLA